MPSIDPEARRSPRWAAQRLARVVLAKLRRSTTEDERKVSRTGLIANAPAQPTVGMLTGLITTFEFDVRGAPGAC